MKRLLTFLVMILLAAGFSFESAAMDAFDASAAGEYAVSEEAVEAKTAGQDDFEGQIFLFTRSIRSVASEFLNRELGISNIHGQPLPGVLITLLLGAAFGLARKRRHDNRKNAHSEQTTENRRLLTARLLRMQNSFLFPPVIIHTVSPGPDLFCQRE